MFLKVNVWAQTRLIKAIANLQLQRNVYSTVLQCSSWIAGTYVQIQEGLYKMTQITIGMSSSKEFSTIFMHILSISKSGDNFFLLLVAGINNLDYYLLTVYICPIKKSFFLVSHEEVLAFAAILAMEQWEFSCRNEFQVWGLWWLNKRVVSGAKHNPQPGLKNQVRPVVQRSV